VLLATLSLYSACFGFSSSAACLFRSTMSSSEAEDEEDVPKIVLPQRATRGNRMQNVSLSKILEFVNCPVFQPLAVMGPPTFFRMFHGQFFVLLTGLWAHQLLEDQESGDEEFWNQEFFAEEGADEEYKTESSSEDEADTDFSEQVRVPTAGCVRGSEHSLQPSLRWWLQV
jgi:hypothetical protein